MELDSFVVSALILLLVTSVTVSLFKLLGLGAVLGLLVAGLIVGPYTPGPVAVIHVDDMRNFTELGVVLLLFLIGLEMRPSRLWAMRREVFGLGTLQIVLSGAAIAAYYAAVGESSWGIAWLVGLTLALSSTAFVLQMLQERGEIASPHGRAAFAVLLMQDLAVVPLLAAVPVLSEVGTLSASVPLWEQVAIVAGMCVVVWVFGRFVVPRALDRLARQGNREGFLLVVMLAVFLAAWAMHEAGMSMALGAFLMGMLLSNSQYNLQIQALIEPHKGLLMSLFFVAVGMSIDLGALAQHPLVFAQHVGVFIVIKLAVLFLLGWLFGLPGNVTARMSFMLAQGGEFGFVLLGAAKALAVVDDETFILGIGVISVSMLVTPLLVRLGDLLAVRLERRAPAPEGSRYHPQPGESEVRVILGGYGRVGHTVAVLLHSSGVPFIAFDRDPARVARGQADGFPVYYGDIASAELLAAAEPERAALVVLAIDDAPAALRAVALLRNLCPGVPVIARARDLETSGELLQAGAIQAFPELVESGVQLAANALQRVGVPGQHVDRLLDGVRGTNYALVRESPEDAAAG